MPGDSVKIASFLQRISAMTAVATVAQLDQFDEIIDVRTAPEFREDHLPGAVNFPVLTAQERERVGTIYKQVSSFEAKKIGVAPMTVCWAALTGRAASNLLCVSSNQKARFLMRKFSSGGNAFSAILRSR